MSEFQKGLTSTQKGRITEQLVAGMLLLASNGRLTPFVPLADDDGVDLIILDKITRRNISVQVKSAIAHPVRPTVQFDIRSATRLQAPGEYLLAVLFDPIAMSLPMTWLIPMTEIPSVANDQGAKFSLAPSHNDASRDRYRRFRYDDARTLSEALSRAINDVGATIGEAQPTGGVPCDQDVQCDRL